jgi:hypothetical protein
VEVPAGAEGDLYDSLLTRTFWNGDRMFRGRLTRDLSVPGAPRTLVVLSCNVEQIADYGLTSDQTEEFKTLIAELRRLRGGYSGLGSVATLKRYHVEAASNGKVRTALLQYGPVPVYPFAERNGLTFALYPINAFPGGLSATGGKAHRLLLRLRSYAKANLRLLFSHYLENIALRFYDIRHHRSPDRAFRECRLMIEGDIVSIESKLQDIDRGRISHSEEVRLLASSIMEQHGAEIAVARYALALTLAYIEDLGRLFNIYTLKYRRSSVMSRREVPWAEVLRRLELDHQDLIGTSGDFDALVGSCPFLGSEAIAVLPRDCSPWAREYALFADFLLALRDAAGTIAENPLQCVAGPPLRLTPSQPACATPADADRQRLIIFFSSHIEIAPSVNEPGRIEEYGHGIFQMVEHGLLLEKMVNNLIPSPPKIEHLSDLAGERQWEKLTGDARVSQQLHSEVLRCMARSSATKPRSGPMYSLDNENWRALTVLLLSYLSVQHRDVASLILGALRFAVQRPVDRGGLKKLMMLRNLAPLEVTQKQLSSRLNSLLRRLRSRVIAIDGEKFPVLILINGQYHSGLSALAQRIDRSFSPGVRDWIEFLDSVERRWASLQRAR